MRERGLLPWSLVLLSCSGGSAHSPVDAMLASEAAPRPEPPETGMAEVDAAVLPAIDAASAPGIDTAHSEAPPPAMDGGIDAPSVDTQETGDLPLSTIDAIRAADGLAPDALVAWPVPIPSACVRVDDGQGASPSLHAVAGRWFAFFTEGSGSTAPLRVRSASLPGLDFGPASTLLHGATKVDLIEDGGRLHALASRQFYAVRLESIDGSVWTEGGNLATSEVDALCTGYTPALFARGGSPPAFLAAGRDTNTHIFGCSPQVVVALPAANGWSAPTTIGKGHPVLAVQGNGIQTIASTFGVYVSHDQGASFTEVRGGDTTAEQLRGTSGALSGNTLVLAQSYGYGVTEPNHIAVIASNDGGATWPRRVILAKSSAYPGDPRIAADGAFLAVAWQMGNDVRLMTSPDSGATWSAPATLGLGLDGGVAQLGGLAVSGTRVALAASGAGVRICPFD